MVQIKKNAAENDIQDEVIAVNRVTKVLKGGRKFSFSVLTVAGNYNGMVGYDLGKANDVSDAKNKAAQRARKNMIRVPLRENRTIHHDVQGRFGAARVILRAAPPGTGVIAGSAVRATLKLLGVQDIVAKSIGSTNANNLVRATIDALQKLSSPKAVAARRNKKIGQIIEQRRTLSGE